MDGARKPADHAPPEVEIIAQPAPLRSKVRMVGPDDPDPVEAAERAMAGGSIAFLDHARGDFAILRRICDEIATRPDEPGDALSRMFGLVHNLKGQGKSFGYDMITEISASLCELLRGQTRIEPSDAKIVMVHVDALGVVFEHDLKGDGGDQGRLLLRRLSGLVSGRPE